ncbi:hypothetical protein Tco_0025756 [Tanacetum coccineum]
MSSSTHHIIVLSDSDVKDAFSSTNTLDYTSASPDYSSASPRNTSSDPSEDLSKDLSAPLTISPFHDDPYIKVMQAYNATSNKSPILLPQAPIAPPTILPPSLVFETEESSHMMRLERHEEHIQTILNHLDELSLECIEHMEDKIEGLGNGRDFYSGGDHQGYPGIMDMINNQDIEHMIPPTPLRDTEPSVGSPIPLSLSSSVGSSSPVRSTTPPPDYPFDKSIFAELDNSLWIIPRPLGSEPVLEKPNKMAPKRTSAMTQAAIRKLVADSVAAALEAQTVNMTNIDNTNRNSQQRKTPVARKCSYKEFMSYQPFNFKGTEGAVGLIRWFGKTELVFLRSNCTEDCKVKFATGTLTEEAFSWWNSFAQPIGIKEAYKVTWEMKKSVKKKYCPRTEELAVLCPNMVPNTEKLMEVFIEGLPQSIEGTITASKPQTLEEATNIAQRLMDQILKHRADKSFISISLASMLNIPPITLDTTYDIEMADGNLVGTNTVI